MELDSNKTPKDDEIELPEEINGGCITDITRLQLALHDYLRKETFGVGDVIEFKSGMCNRKGGDNRYYIVVELLTPPVQPKAPAGSAFFAEPLDIRAFYLEADNSACDILLHSARMTLVKKAAEPSK